MALIKNAIKGEKRNLNRDHPAPHKIIKNYTFQHAFIYTYI